MNELKLNYLAAIVTAVVMWTGAMVCIAMEDSQPIVEASTSVQSYTPDLRDAAWLAINRDSDEWTEEGALGYLKDKATSFDRVIIKIRMTRPGGFVDWEVWSRLENWERKSLRIFISQHVKRSRHHTVEMYAGYVDDPVALWKEIRQYVRSGMSRRYIMDAATRPEHRVGMLKMVDTFAEGQFAIGTEALGLDENGDWLAETEHVLQVCSWRYWYKHAILNGEYLVVPEGREVLVRLRRYTNDLNVPDPTLEDVQKLRDAGAAIAYSYAYGVQLGIKEQETE